jgi:glycosyltransferase involved in cell wall biosynthesis
MRGSARSPALTLEAGAEPAGERPPSPANAEPSVAVVVPCFRTSAQVMGVLASIGPEVGAVYCVDDACPEGTGDLIERSCRDPRVKVIRHARNGGVGAAVRTGYRAAMDGGAEVVVKLDSDGQMDGSAIPLLVSAIAGGRADYCKGNRFFYLEDLGGMPFVRLIGNLGLSFAAKLASGYWSVFDPTNGFTAIHARLLERINLDRLDDRYFFESDLLFRLGALRARVVDVPMAARYGGEPTSMSPLGMILPFLFGTLRNTVKRLVYSYFLRDFSAASLMIVVGLASLVFGVAYGAHAWWVSAVYGRGASSGQVMIAALPIIVGVQMLIAFITYDVEREPREALHPLLNAARRYR